MIHDLNLVAFLPLRHRQWDAELERAGVFDAGEMIRRESDRVTIEVEFPYPVRPDRDDGWRIREALAHVVFRAAPGDRFVFRRGGLSIEDYRIALNQLAATVRNASRRGLGSRYAARVATDEPAARGWKLQDTPNGRDDGARTVDEVLQQETAMSYPLPTNHVHAGYLALRLALAYRRGLAISGRLVHREDLAELLDAASRRFGVHAGNASKNTEAMVVAATAIAGLDFGEFDAWLARERERGICTTESRSPIYERAIVGPILAALPYLSDGRLNAARTWIATIQYEVARFRRRPVSGTTLHLYGGESRSVSTARDSFNSVGQRAFGSNTTGLGFFESRHSEGLWQLLSGAPRSRYQLFGLDRTIEEKLGLAGGHVAPYRYASSSWCWFEELVDFPVVRSLLEGAEPDLSWPRADAWHHHEWEIGEFVQWIERGVNGNKPPCLARSHVGGGLGAPEEHLYVPAVIKGVGADRGHCDGASASASGYEVAIRRPKGAPAQRWKWDRKGLVEEGVSVPVPDVPEAGLDPHIETEIDPEDGLAVRFRSRTGGTPQFYRWDFGDGETSRRREPRHRYKEPGTYVVNLTVGRRRPKATAVTATPIAVVRTLPEEPADPAPSPPSPSPEPEPEEAPRRVVITIDLPGESATEQLIRLAELVQGLSPDQIEALASVIDRARREEDKAA